MFFHRDDTALGQMIVPIATNTTASTNGTPCLAENNMEYEQMLPVQATYGTYCLPKDFDLNFTNIVSLSTWKTFTFYFCYDYNIFLH